MTITLILLLIVMAYFVLVFLVFGIMWICFEISFRTMARKHRLYKEALFTIYKHDMIRIVKKEKIPPPNGEEGFNWSKFYLKSYDEIKKPKTIKDIFRQEDEYEQIVAYIEKNIKVWDEDIEECYKWTL